MIETGSYILSSFTLQLMAAELMFCLFLQRRPKFWLRLAGCIVPFVLLTYDMPFITFLNGISLRFIITFLISIGIMYFCFEASIQSVLFCTISGYAVRGCSMNLYVLTEFLRGRTFDEKYDILFYLIFIVVYILCFHVFAKRLKRKEMIDFSNRKVLAVALSIVVVDELCGMWRWVYYLPLNPVCPIYGFMSCILVLGIQYQLYQESALKRQNVIMEQILRKEKEQYELSKENIKLLNLKCHDIKHNVSLLKNTVYDKDTACYIDELERTASEYDDIAKTGNSSLDIVLTEKKNFCNKYQIVFTFMADGKSLSFMSALDIYSLFGNILDNALECEQHEKDIDKRSISLKIFQKAGYLYIHQDNFCSKMVEFEEGIPLSTKKDKGIHGFGVKSVQYIVDKYEGMVKFSQQDHRFSVDILIPIQTVSSI